MQPTFSRSLRALVGIAALTSMTVAMPALAGPLARFELSCTSCAMGGSFSRTWTTPLEAWTAVGYQESAPGAFFKIDVPEFNSGTFYAHSETYPNGYNFFDDTVQVAMAGPSSSLIFDGPTSAPTWRVGVYEDVVNYFQQGSDQGRARLAISVVPTPATLPLVLAGLLALGLGRARRT